MISLFHSGSVGVSCCSIAMFMVKELVAFLAGATAFSDTEEVEKAVSEYGLEIDTDTCAACPTQSTMMQLPHVFVHKYCGLEMFE